MWGGSHDVHLGMLLWMYRIPTFSFSSIYKTNRSEYPMIRGQPDTIPIVASRHFMAHRVNNMRRRDKATVLVNVDHRDMSDLFGDFNHSLYFESQGSARARLEAKAVEQKKVGARGANLLYVIKSTTDVVRHSPSWADKFENLAHKFEAFTPADCYWKD